MKKIKILALLQARTSSSRLPGKVLLDILGTPMLLRQIERENLVVSIDHLVVVTSSDKSDDLLSEVLHENDIDYYRGSLNDVLDRFYQAAKLYKPEHVVRLTGDCPLVDPEVVENVIRMHIDTNADYTSNIFPATYPDGLDVEVMKFSALEIAWKESELPSEREHVTPFIRNNKERFLHSNLEYSCDLSSYRWTVDELQDFEFVKKVYEKLYKANPTFNMDDIINYLDTNPELAKLNAHFVRNESSIKSFKEDEAYLIKKRKDRYKESNKLLERALKTIPLGSQTFSKSITQFPKGISPLFIDHGMGSHVWDVDGNEYIDFLNGLLSVSIGYCDPDITNSVILQLKKGITFSLPHKLEIEVSEMLVELIPCAEMVRFGKNGSDATSAAVRLSRAYTNRDHIIVCGYHGWQDWYIGSTARDLGVPESVKNLTHVFTYNDLDSLKEWFHKYPSDIAAVIMEPMSVEWPNQGFLESVKEIAHQYGAILIFDETISGFRFSIGGAQELFGVTPDLATFGKGLANGMPLSTVLGRRDIMLKMEDIFFSGTFSGETLSLAAAKVVLKKIKNDNIVERLAEIGQLIIDSVGDLIVQSKVDDFIQIKGHPSWSHLIIKDTKNYTSWEIKTLLFQEMFKRGVLSIGSHNISYSHSEEDVSSLLNAYKEVFYIIYLAVHKGKMSKLLEVEPLRPLFKVR